VVIGVDDYQFERKLHGSVNDANMIAQALRPIGRDTKLMVNGDVRRDAVLGAMADALTVFASWRHDHPDLQRAWRAGAGAGFRGVAARLPAVLGHAGF